MVKHAEVGSRIGRLTVVGEPVPERSSHYRPTLGRHIRRTEYRQLCRCDCGEQKDVLVNNLLSGNTKSCGCLKQTHGMRHSSEYRVWEGMKQRCLNPNNDRFADYGGRGISIHPEWIVSFESFLAHVGARPSPAHTLDRIDNGGNYAPENVRWATRSEQQQNTRRRRIMLTSPDGRTMSAHEWAKELGVTPGAIRQRICDGYPPERLFLPRIKG